MSKNSSSTNARGIPDNSSNAETTHFAATTTMHGIHQMSNAPHCILRVIWVMIFLTMTCLMVWHTQKQVTKYFSYPFQTSITMQRKLNAEFPAVTVCNINSVKRSLIKQQDFWNGLIEVENVTGNLVQILKYLNNLGNSTTENRSLGAIPAIEIKEEQHTLVRNRGGDHEKGEDYDGKNIQNQKIREDYDFLNYLNPEDFKDLKNIIYALVKSSKSSDLSDIANLISLPPDVVEKCGYTKEEFILECTSDEKPCPGDAFTKFYDYNYGNCYTFNFNSSLKITNLYGSPYGLRLSLDLKIDEYIGLLSSEYGARISVQVPKAEALPSEDGFNAAPGQLTAVGLKMSKMARLKKPYPSNCVSQFPEEYSPYVIRGSSYTFDGCWLACFNKFLIKECSCIDWSSMITNRSVEHCSIFENPKVMHCYMRVYDEVEEANYKGDEENQYYCHGCLYPCEETIFEKTISISGWPSKAYQNLQVAQKFPAEKISQIMFGDVYETELIEILDQWREIGLSKSKYAEKNIVRLHVYFETLDVNLVEEYPAYPANQLFADLGGVLGLYLGSSIVTLLEVLQYILIKSLNMKLKRK